MFSFLWPAAARADHPSVTLGSGLSGPIITLPPTTLPRGRAAVTFRTEVVRFDRRADTELRAIAAHGQEVDDLGALFGQYRLVHLPQFELAALGGLKLATGQTGVTDRRGARFEPEHQPGTGSLDHVRVGRGPSRKPAQWVRAPGAPADGVRHERGAVMEFSVASL
ncbi:MAG: hypothetical protein HYY76_09010 [Acidobacteria bacterium]|nr:hypothetical protein [Acidobacteriota bacterium]